MPELLENESLIVSDRHSITVNLLDGSKINVDITELAEYIDNNRDNIKFSKSQRRRESLGFPED